MGVQHLSASRRRTRKYQLARRDGQRCTYCRRPFASLREATLDHVVPVSLLRTWSVGALVLACRPCNQAKADRLPLSMALLIVWTYGPDLRDETRHTPRHTDPTGEGATPAETISQGVPRCDLPGSGLDRAPDPSPVHLAEAVFTVDRPVVTDTDPSTRRAPVRLGPGEVNWLMLARLVHARQTRERSTPGQTKHRNPDRRAVRAGRLAHPRRTARLNTCEQPTDRGVSA
ncbi:HNH endonuclease [Streptomyces sp. NBC_01471]|uniref:HNH endonuclease n=1 Tax=Streptomyces sp. NBC_01471 TaxID=2903879 RepID=UPI0032478891